MLPSLVAMIGAVYLFLLLGVGAVVYLSYHPNAPGATAVLPAFWVGLAGCVALFLLFVRHLLGCAIGPFRALAEVATMFTATVAVIAAIIATLD